MSERDRIAEIGDLRIREFNEELESAIESLKRGVKPGNAFELLAASLKISSLCEELKTSLEKWLQVDLWEKVEETE